MSVRVPVLFRWRFLVPLVVVVIAATYLDFGVFGPPTRYDIIRWLLVVPLLLASAIEGLADYPWYPPTVYGMLVGVGVIQYLDGHSGLLTLIYLFGGIAGLVDWLTPGSWLTNSCDISE